MKNNELNKNNIENGNKRLKINESEIDNGSLNIIREYGKGNISLKECYRKLAVRQENKDNIRDLTEILNQKLEKEFEDFCRKMEEKEPKEIVKKAYEITVKEELKEEIKNMRLAEKEKAIMIDQNDLLTEFYHDWLNTDVPLGESLRDTLEDSVAMLTRYYGKQNKFIIDEEIDR